MKKDMGGAAHVLGLANLIMQLELPISLQVLIPAVDNAISSDAYRPGDVLNTRLGKTVEIHNTDAEGRLVLADALDIPREDSLAALRDVPADELFAVYDETFASHYHAPAIDHQLLTESTWKTIQSGALLGRELIIGSNYHEWYANTAEDTTWDDVVREGPRIIEGIDY